MLLKKSFALLKYNEMPKINHDVFHLLYFLNLQSLTISYWEERNRHEVGLKVKWQILKGRNFERVVCFVNIIHCKYHQMSSLFETKSKIYLHKNTKIKTFGWLSFQPG